MDPQGRLKEHVTCPVCLDIYRYPKILSCQHTLCTECAGSLPVTKKWEDGSSVIKCPVCREGTVLPRGGIDNLPAAFQINNLIELYEATKALPAGTAATQSKALDGNDVEPPSVHRDEVNSHLGKLDHQISSITTALDAIDNREEDVNQQGVAVKAEIDMMIEKVIQQLRSSGRKLKVSVDASVNDQITPLVVMREEGQMALSELQKCAATVRKKLKVELEIDEQGKKPLIQKIVDVSGAYDPRKLMPRKQETIRLMPNKMLLDNCSFLGEITVSEGSEETEAESDAEVDLSSIVATASGRGFTFCIARKENEIQIKLPAHVKGQLEVEFVHKVDKKNQIFGTIAKPIHSVFTDTKTYTVTFKPKWADKHEIKVLVNKTEIPCKPNTIRVLRSPELLGCYIFTSAAFGGCGVGAFDDGTICYSYKKSSTEWAIVCSDHYKNSLSVMQYNHSTKSLPIAATHDYHVVALDVHQRKVFKISKKNVILCDTSNHRIRFNRPHSVATDIDNMVYVTDGCTVVKLAPDLSRILDTFTYENSNLSGICVDSNKVIYVCDIVANSVTKLSSNGLKHTFGKSVLDQPIGIAIDQDNLVYVTDEKRRVVMFDGDGTHLGEVGNDKDHHRFTSPCGIACSTIGHIYVGDLSRGAIMAL